MNETCKYQRNGYECVFGAFHTVRYHHLDNGENDAIGDAVAPPSVPLVAKDQWAGELGAELVATGACVAALEDLDAEQRAHVVRFLDGRFGNHIAPSGGFVQQMAGRTVRRLVQGG